MHIVSSPLGRAVAWLVGLVVAIDMVAIALYYTLHISLSSAKTQEVFTVTWMVVVLVIVVVQLRRIRVVRFGTTRRR